MRSVLDGLEAFVAVCEAGNITAAAEQLGTPRATLSRQLTRLEAHLGVRLLYRTTRRVVPCTRGLAMVCRQSSSWALRSSIS